MELTNEFRVGVPVAEAWAVLTDVERIAPCMPGAQLTEVDGDTYTGNVKVKVGPITAQYKGTATFVEKDDVAHVARLKADGRDTRGQGNASAMVTATLEADGDGTNVTVVTDLTVTGKVAQFGRGVLADVSAKLVGQFVACLESDVLSGEGSGSGGGSEVSGDGSEVGSGDGEPATAAQAGVEPDRPAPEAASPSTGSAPSATPSAGTAPGGPAPSSDGSIGDAAPLAAEPAGTAADPAAAGSGPTAAPVTPSTTSGPRRIDSREVAAVDLLGTAGVPVVKRVAPLFGVVVVVVWLLRRRRRSA